MTTLQQIEEFIATEPLALIGVSRNPKKFGYSAFKELREKGMNIIPVNHHASEILGVKAFPDVKSLPDNVKGVIIMTQKDQTATVVREERILMHYKPHSIHKFHGRLKKFFGRFPK